MTDHTRRLTQLQQDYDRLKKDFTLSTLKFSREFLELKAQLDASVKMQGAEPSSTPLAPQGSKE